MLLREGGEEQTCATSVYFPPLEGLPQHAHIRMRSILLPLHLGSRAQLQTYHAFWFEADNSKFQISIHFTSAGIASKCVNSQVLPC